MSTPAPERNPYVGPRQFENEPEDIARFFGRSREARDIVSLVLAQRAVVIYGKSGTGKSSLLNAGVLPVLDERGVDVLRPLARVQRPIPPAIRPEQIHNIYLYNALAKWIGDDATALKCRTLKDFTMQRPPVHGKDGTPSIKVMIFDQFEELFTSYHARWDDREAFFELVDDALAEDRLLRIIFAIREEYIADLDSYSYLVDGHLKIRFHLEPLHPEQATLAVTKPVEQTRREFDPDAADHLVTELRAIPSEQVSDGARNYEQFVEPVVLQVVCQSLWDALDQWEKANDSPVQTIGIEEVDQHAHIDDALIRFYENCIQQAVEATRAADGDDLAGARAADSSARPVTVTMLREWFENELIMEGGRRRPVVREGSKTGGMDNFVVDELVARHIIRVEERRATASLYEIVHDRFVEPILESNRRWWHAETQRQAERQQRRQRQLLVSAAAVISLFVLAVVFLSSYLIQSANEEADATISELELGSLIQARVPGLGDTAPTVIALTKASVSIASFSATASAQEALASTWEPTAKMFDGVEMVYVPAGCFWMGSTAGEENEQPIFEACSRTPFWIDRYEVTNAQYAEKTGSGESFAWREGEIPKTRISWRSSVDYCRDIHPDYEARLPTETEWEYAARGPLSLLYPWGNNAPGDYVIYAPYFIDSDTLTLENPQAQPVRTEDGEPARSRGGSWVGAYDMSGNVREWTMNEDSSYPLIDTSPAMDSDTGQILRIVRGGSYSSPSDFTLRTSIRVPAVGDFSIPDTGFRCVIVAEG